MPHHHVVRLFAILCCVLDAAAQETVRHFSVRADGRVVGSLTETESPATEDGRAVSKFVSESVTKIEMLGSPIEQRVEQTWLLDPTTRAVLRCHSLMTVGNHKTELAGHLVDGRFQVEGSTDPLDPTRVVIAPDFRWLLQRGPQRPGEQVDVDYLLPELGGVHPCTVRMPADADRELDLLGRKTAVRAYELSLVTLGLDSTVLVARDTGEMVRYEMPGQKIVMERVAAAELGHADRVDLTDRILVRTNLDVADPASLTFVRVRATIDTGKQVTAAALQVPGQSFEGTVENGRIEGVFEIRPRRSDGTGSPAFPAPKGAFAAESLRPYLEPEPQIDSGDAGIARQARELAQGAKTCFEVVDRLARWTHEEIAYVIPGGGSAKGTYDSRQGECGGHSRVLAAMLRSLGIPARTPMGGMYTPLHGGSFAQHMWTEVWLGEAIGWLAVDCTAGESTYIDAGHIRLGDGPTVFGPRQLEVLDHEPKAPVVDASVPTAVRRSDAWPFAAGTPLIYHWTRSGQALGDERVTYGQGGDGVHLFDSSVQLAGGAFRETTRTEVGDDGRLLSFHAERTQGPQQSTFDVTMADGKAVCASKTLDGERSDTVAIDSAAFVLHNSCMAHFLVPLCRYWPLADGAEVKVRMLHTEQRAQFSMTMRGGGSEAISIGGTEVRARTVQVELAGLAITLHVDDRGRLLRYYQKQGDVTIELQSL